MAGAKKVFGTALAPHQEGLLTRMLYKIDTWLIGRLAARNEARIANFCEQSGADLLVVETRDFHGEVVRAVVDQATEVGCRVALILNKALKKRVVGAFGHEVPVLFCSRTIARASLQVAKRLGVLTICTTDFHGVPRYVLRPEEFQEGGIKTVVHDYERFATEHLRYEKRRGRHNLEGYQIWFAAPQVQHLAGPNICLMRRPYEPRSGGSRWETRREERHDGRSIAVVGHSATNPTYYDDMARLTGEFRDFRFVFLGNGSPKEKALLLAQVNCDVTRFGEIVADDVIDCSILEVDFILFTKDLARYRLKWSGSAALSLSLGVPLIAHQGLLKEWGFGPECSLGFANEAREALAVIRGMSDDAIETMRAATRELGQERFAKSCTEFRRQVTEMSRDVSLASRQ